MGQGVGLWIRQSDNSFLLGAEASELCILQASRKVRITLVSPSMRQDPLGQNSAQRDGLQPASFI